MHSVLIEQDKDRREITDEEDAMTKKKARTKRRDACTLNQVNQKITDKKSKVIAYIKSHSIILYKFFIEQY